MVMVITKNNQNNHEQCPAMVQHLVFVTSQSVSLKIWPITSAVSQAG